MNKKAYFSCFLLLWALVMPSASMAATLHSIIVGDTDASDIGQSVNIDVKRLGELARNISENTGLRSNIQTITGNQLTVSNVKNAVNRISVSSDDVVFFYWTGHGYSRGNTVLPTMHIDKYNLEANVDLKQIAGIIQAKQPRLLIVIGDTCNKPIDANRRDIQLMIRNADNYKELFLKHRGEVFAVGSETGGYSYGSSQKGGAYTTSFLNSLTIELASTGIPSWKDLMQRADKPIQVAPGIVQKPISNTRNVTYMGSLETNEEDCDEMRRRPDGTCGFSGGSNPFLAPSGSDSCTDPSKPGCW